MSAAPRPRLVIVDGVPMSAVVAEAADPKAVILAIHGGGTTAMYFDCPGYPSYSLVRAGAAAGFTVVALDRPGYGSSAPYPEAMARPRATSQPRLRGGGSHPRRKIPWRRLIRDGPFGRL